MHAMKTLTFGVGGAALASAIGFIYAQATTEGLALMPRFDFEYSTPQRAPQSSANPGMDTTVRHSSSAGASSTSQNDVETRREDNSTAPRPTDL